MLGVLGAIILSACLVFTFFLIRLILVFTLIANIFRISLKKYYRKYNPFKKPMIGRSDYFYKFIKMCQRSVFGLRQVMVREYHLGDI